MPYMKKTIYSGRVLEIEKYPVSRTGSRIPRNGRHQLTKESQKNLNEKNSLKKFIRIIETNYTQNDLFITLKYRGKAPDNAQIKRDAQNFIRRLKYHCNKLGLTPPVCVYRAVDKVARPHIHAFLNNYSWDFIKSLWDKGSVHLSNLEPDYEYGFTAVAKYFMNEKNKNAFDKNWCATKNLKKPKIVYKPIKRLNIYQRVEPPKGYKVINVEITDNAFTGFHQYIRCIKIE